MRNGTERGKRRDIGFIVDVKEDVVCCLSFSIAAWIDWRRFANEHCRNIVGRAMGAQ